MKSNLHTCFPLVVVAALALLAPPVRAGSPEINRPHGHEFDDHGTVAHRTAHDGGPRGLTFRAPVNRNIIAYHNGPVMLGTVNVYVIWYGNWAGNTATNIVPDFLNSIGGSPYHNINTTYFNRSGAHVANSVAFLGSTTDNYSQGAALSDAQVQLVVASAINGGQLPKDTAGVYFVLTSADVTASSGFCTQYCGWHTFGTIGGSNIKYAFVGNPDRCPTACTAQSTVSPNGNIGADGMISIIAHELEETITDPNLNAWFDGFGAENADKCAWTFGTTYTTTNGSTANMALGGRNYLIQRNWLNANGGTCTLSY